VSALMQTFVSEWYLITSSVRFELVVVSSIPLHGSGSLHRIYIVGEVAVLSKPLLS
jgi:hypothetical protein